MRNILSIRLKLFFRNQQNFKILKFGIKYLIIFIPLYIVFIHNIYAFNNLYYVFSICTVLILGMDYITVLNGSNVNTIFLYNYLLDRKKSIVLAFFSDMIIKFFTILPIFFVVKYKLLFVLLFLVFCSLSFFLKEIVSVKLITNKVYGLLVFISVIFFTLLGGVFLDFTPKILNIINYTESYFYEIYSILLGLNILISIVFIKMYLKNYHVTSRI